MRAHYKQACASTLQALVLERPSARRLERQGTVATERLFRDREALSRQRGSFATNHSCSFVATKNSLVRQS